jgi:cytochrome c1
VAAADDHDRPGTIMPDLGVSEQEARDIAAYLYSDP